MLPNSRKLLLVLTIPLALHTSIALAADPSFDDLDEKAKFGDVKTDVRLRSSVLIKARPNVVWQTIHEQRTVYKELEYAKIVSHDETTSITEQRFAVALLGEATCTFRMIDFPPNHIDYELMKSDMFAAMDGSWVILPTPDRLSTRIDLYCHAGLQKKVPRFLLKLGLSRSLRRHLDAIKKSSEDKDLLSSI